MYKVATDYFKWWFSDLSENVTSRAAQRAKLSQKFEGIQNRIYPWLRAKVDQQIVKRAGYNEYHIYRIVSTRLCDE